MKTVNEVKFSLQYGGINVDVQVTEGGTYITFTQYHAGDAPALIINHTNHDISFWEKGNINERFAMTKIILYLIDENYF